MDMDEHDPVIDRLGRLARQPLDPATTARHLEQMARAPRTRRASGVRWKVGVAFFAGLLLGGTGLATAGALPGPVQNVAHTTLSDVGVNVPDGHGPKRYNGPECGTDPQTGQPFKNHGQYVKAHKNDPNAGQSRCGKPVQAGTETPGVTEPPESPEPTDAPEPTEVPGKGAAPEPTEVPGKGAAHANKGNGDQGDQADETTTTLAPKAATVPSTTTVPPTTVPSTTTVPPTTTTR
jgi:hypothetical protein